MPTYPNTGPVRNGRAAFVSGASFAGLATAFWLDKLGYKVTVVEVAEEFRRGGTPVDIEGETIEVLSRMGLIDAVRTKALPSRRFEFKDLDDVTLGSIGAGGGPASSSRYEIHRDDLLDILSEAVVGRVEILFDRSIARLDDGPEQITVTLSDGDSRECALVFGCDGNRSNIRRLLFDAGEQFTYFMGGYFYLKVIPQTGLLPANFSQICSVPGRMAMLNGYDDRTDIGFGFRTEKEIAYDYRDKAQQLRLIQDRFSGMGWKVPAMLSSIGGDNDFYFDRINQIRMPSWSKGRVALVGDAGYCVSPLAGLGGSMALIGAGRLADALVLHPDDYTAAFEHYEVNLRPFVEQVQQRAAIEGMSMMCPADDAELAERDRKLAAGDIGF